MTDSTDTAHSRSNTLNCPSSLIHDLQPLLEGLEEHTLILTPNQRLSRFVQSHNGEYQQQQGRQAWLSVACLSHASWLMNLWTQGQLIPSTGFNERLLASHQELFIWQKIINDNSDDLELFNSSAAAKTASDAWHNLIRWQQDPTAAEEQNESPLQRWSRAFKHYCKEHQLIDSSSMQRRLLAHFKSSPTSMVDSPSSVILLGFDDIAPLSEAFFEHLHLNNCPVEQVDLCIKPASITRVCAGDERAELRAAAQWAASELTKNATARIAIVIPDLAANRLTVEHVLTESFEPQYSLPESLVHANGFNISASQPLSEAPIIQSALKALALNHHELSINDASYLLHSPFIGGHNELAARSALAAELREQYETIRVSLLRAQLGRTPRPGKPSLLSDTSDCINRLHTLTITKQPLMSPGQWVDVFSQQLAAIGWPGQRSLDTLEYQQWSQWQALLIQFSELEHLFPTLNLRDALYYLEQTAIQAAFQAQTKDSPIQVLGLLEAAGLTFDALWITGLDDQHWPEKPKPNALIPPALQRQLNMPKASSEKERDLALRLTERFLHSAHTVIVSHSQYREDQAQTVSQLIADIEPTELSELTGHSIPSYAQQLLAHSAMELVDDHQAPTVCDPSLIRGGSQIIKDQAACAFRAFAIHRLQARGFGEYQPGLNAAERGNLVHLSLEIIWQHLDGQQALMNLTDDQQQTLIDRAIEDSFIKLKRPEPIGPQLRTIEHQRLKRLLNAWLTLDRQRAPFNVMHNESSQAVSLGTLPIAIRYDRVDQLSDDSVVIVDYKTGKTNVNRWFSERPDEPQLLLYCVTSETPVSGITFGEINTDTVALKGLSETDTIAPGIKSFDAFREKSRLDNLPESWPALVSYWQENLNTLANNFINGDAEVDPKNHLSCQYCQLHGLCRIKDNPNATEDTDEELNYER